MPSREDPEQFLAAALRAQAVGGGPEPSKPITLAQPTRPARLPWARVLLFAVLLGLVAGGIAGFLSMT